MSLLNQIRIGVLPFESLVRVAEKEVASLAVVPPRLAGDLAAKVSYM